MGKVWKGFFLVTRLGERPIFCQTNFNFSTISFQRDSSLSVQIIDLMEVSKLLFY